MPTMSSWGGFSSSAKVLKGPLNRSSVGDQLSPAMNRVFLKRLEQEKNRTVSNSGGHTSIQIRIVDAGDNSRQFVL